MILRTSPPQILKFIRSTLRSTQSVIRSWLVHELVPTSTDLHVCSHAVAGDLSTVPHTLHSLRSPHIILGDVRRHFCRDRRDIIVVVPIGNGAHLGGYRSDAGWSVECTTLDWEGLTTLLFTKYGNQPAYLCGLDNSRIILTDEALWLAGYLVHRAIKVQLLHRDTLCRRYSQISIHRLRKHPTTTEDYIPDGPPRTGPRPVNRFSACEIAETSSAVMRCPASAACLSSATVGRSRLMILCIDMMTSAAERLDGLAGEMPFSRFSSRLNLYYEGASDVTLKTSPSELPRVVALPVHPSEPPEVGHLTSTGNIYWTEVIIGRPFQSLYDLVERARPAMDRWIDPPVSQHTTRVNTLRIRLLGFSSRKST